MIKKILYIVGVFLLTVFVWQNTAHVPVVFLNTKAHFRSVFLMFSCFVAGFLAGYYFVFRKEEQLVDRIRRLKLQLARERGHRLEG